MQFWVRLYMQVSWIKNVDLNFWLIILFPSFYLLLFNSLWVITFVRLLLDLVYVLRRRDTHTYLENK